MKPRERAGQDSMASAAPHGHSAPIPMPSRARKKNKKAKVGENPAMKLHSEYQRMEIISGAFRPMRSAIQPAAVAPTRRSHSVMVNTAVTAVKGTSNSLAIGTMIKRKMVKSNASRVQPKQSRYPRLPLLPRRLFPPRHLAGHLDRYRHLRPSGFDMLDRLFVDELGAAAGAAASK